MDRDHLSASEDSNLLTSDTDMPQECTQGDSHYDQTSTLDVDSSETWNEPDRHPWDKIGMWGLIILVLGTTCIGIAIGILTFLWANSMAAPDGLGSGTFWRYIVFQGWATRLVTLCAAVIRLVIVSQAGLITSMIASILLEKLGVQLWAVPLLALVRSITVAPETLLRASLPNHFRLSSKVLCYFAILLSTLITLASQFFSTVLLSDFTNTTIVGDANKSSIPFTYTTSAIAALPWGRSNEWQIMPDTYPRFAEYHEPPHDFAEDREDTGMTLRAFLPFREIERRIPIREYRGPATVFDSRVICVRPIVNITRIIAYKDPTFVPDTAASGLYIEGVITLDPRNLPSDLPYHWRFRQREGGGRFLCKIKDDDVYGYNVLSLCEIWLDQPPGSHAAGIMVFNITMPENGSDDIYGIWYGYEEQVYNNQSMPWSILNSGIWTTASLGSSRHGLISMTMCISFASGLEFPVMLYSSTDGFEPSLKLDDDKTKTVFQTINTLTPTPNETQYSTMNTTQYIFNTEAIRYQMGVMHEISSLEDRGLLALNFSATDWTKPLTNEEWTGPGNRMDLADTLYSIHLNATRLGLPDAIDGLVSTTPSSVMVFAVGPGDLVDINYAYVALFQDIFASLQNPALALQALITIFNYGVYSRQMPFFSNSSEASIRNSVVVLIPRRWWGFIFILAIVLVHLALTFSIAIWFQFKTRTTMLGNTWQAIAQATSEVTMPIYSRATKMQDKEIKKILRRAAGSQQEFGISAATPSGRSELVRFSLESNST